MDSKPVVRSVKMVHADESKCCGCGLCAIECPVSAISMREDASGFVYPFIDEGRCISCGKCERICSFNGNHSFLPPIACYAGIRNDKEKLRKSSSGGAFAAVAEAVLAEGGAVCGARMNENFSISHALIETPDRLEELLGSKYVQSDLMPVYGPVKEKLKAGKTVLFCGTPCQVDAIKRFAGAPDNLIAMEIICHGVPNQKMFRSYLGTISKRRIRSFLFRDKDQGWSFNHKVTFEDGSVKRINHRLSSYMTMFMSGAFYRESCFACPYAQGKRGADITIGDFWGIVRKRPELAKEIQIDDGVSCVIVNTEKGLKNLKSADIKLFPVSFDNIAEGNGPLNQPSRKAKNRTELLKLWSEHMSWAPVDAYCRKNCFKIRYYAWAMLPKSIRHIVRVILKVR